MGVMLYSTGCADYDEDITALSNKVDQLISGEIQPLKADLAKVKSDLEAAIAAAKAELEGVHQKDVKALQEADAALDTKLATANDKILDLEEALNEEVEALEADIAALNTAIEAAKKAAADGDAALKAELEKQISALSTKLDALETKLNGDIAKLREDAEKAIAAANAAIDAVEDRAAALEAADEAFAEELKTIKADIKAIQDDLAAKYDELTKAVANLKDQVSENTKDIAALEENLSKLSETVEGINTTLGEHLAAYAKFEAATNSKIAAIEGQISDINGAIETINGTLEDLQKQIDDNDADIEDIYTQIDLLVKADAAMNEAIGALETDLSDLKANLKTELEKAFGDVYDTIDALSEDLNGQLTEVRGELAGQKEALTKLQGALDAEKAAREAEDKKLSDALTALQEELNDQVEALNGRIDEVEAAYKAADEQLQANLDAAVETLNDAIADAIDESKAYTDEEIANLKAQLTDQHKKDITALADRVNDVRNELVGMIDKVYEDMDAMYADLNKAINCLNKSVEEIKADIDAILNRVQSVVYIPEYSDGKATVEWAAYITGIDEQNKQLAYNIMPKTSHIDFQIYPAECAEALAEAWNNADEDLKSFLSFDWTGVTVRSGEEVSFDIEAVEADEEGVLHIDFKAYELSKSFYSLAIMPVAEIIDPALGEIIDSNEIANYIKVVQVPNTKGYSISLVIDNELENISSSYVNLICDVEPETFVARLFVNGDDCSDAIEEITDNSYPTFTIPYTDRLAYNVVFTDDEDGIADGTTDTHKYEIPEVKFYEIHTDEFYSWTDLNEKGYNVERPDFKFWSVFAEETDAAYFNSFVALTNGMAEIGLPGALPEDEWLWALAGESLQVGPDFNFATKLNLTDEANAESVGTMMALNIAYDVMGVELSTGEIIKIGKAVGEAAGTVADIVWSFEEDVDVDAERFAGNDADYYRTVDVTIDEENAKLYDFAGKYSEFIQSTVEATVAEVAEDGTETEVEGVVATLAANADENVTLAIDGFEFDKTYKLTFLYELESIDITVEVLVNTIDRSREAVTLSKEHSIEYTHRPTINATKESNEEYGIEPMKLDTLYDLIVARDAEIGVEYPAEADFLKSIFDDNKTFEDPKKVVVDNKLYWFGMDEATQTPGNIQGQIAFLEMLGRGAAYLGVNGADRAAYVRYHSLSWNNVNHKRIEYTQTYKTWYGQEVILKYTLNFDIPTKYDFKHNRLWVFETDGYYSNVKARYMTYKDGRNEVDTYSKALTSFSVYDVDMERAFDVVETLEDGTQKIMTPEEIAAANLTVKFEFVTAPEDPNIKFIDEDEDGDYNTISYGGKDEKVYVIGKLFMSGDVQLPTSFDTAKEGEDAPKYSKYHVNQFNPLCDLSINEAAPKKVEVTEVKKYSVDVIDYFDLFEAREGNKTAYVWADGSKVNLIDHETKTWMKGDGTNGWYKNKTRTDIYGLTAQFEMVSTIPDEFKNAFYWDPANGLLEFDASKTIEMATDVPVTIKMSVELPWSKVESNEVTIVFGPKSKVVAPEETPAE